MPSRRNRNNCSNAKISISKSGISVHTIQIDAEENAHSDTERSNRSSPERMAYNDSSSSRSTSPEPFIKHRKIRCPGVTTIRQKRHRQLATIVSFYFSFTLVNGPIERVQLMGASITIY